MSSDIADWLDAEEDRDPICFGCGLLLECCNCEGEAGEGAARDS